MTLTGDMLIGAAQVHGRAGAFRAWNPVLGTEMEPAFGIGDATDVERACTLARSTFDPFRAVPLDTRARLLETIAQNILDLGDALLERASAESGLPLARLQGERARTVGQLQLFAKIVRGGDFLAAAIDVAQPQRKPLPRVDLRLTKIGVGPVAVFGASNFPLAFSVAGGDTASALAAGCPVVVKAHPAHPGTSELVGRAIQRAVAACGLPEGVFSLVHGEREVGAALVAHPAVQAVGFTGSRQGGLALVNIANTRALPIPVYAEMSSINPMFLLPAALDARAETLGQQFIDSLTLGVGQFCTNPGLVIGLAGAALDRFCAAAAAHVAQKAAGAMLTPGIAAAYRQGVATWSREAGVEAFGAGQAAESNCAAQAALYRTDVATFVASPALHNEIFGPAALVVVCETVDQMLAVAEHIEGQLTATLQLDTADETVARRLLPVLERKVGRILANGFPTGVEVGYAMVHGGPFPATSNALFTSVGATAIERFLRPVCYQDLPDSLLPLALQQHNPLRIARLVDGVRNEA
ncbi:MAG TPA: aldehyde dehydrogenase (NADP(+)) [Paraburkholderia sp.]